MFKDERRDVHDEGRNARPSVVSDNLVQSVDQTICERRRFINSELSCKFPLISRNVLYEIIAVRLGYHKLCANLVLKMLTGEHKMQIVAWAETF
jgi:hypothetical protein